MERKEGKSGGDLTARAPKSLFRVPVPTRRNSSSVLRSFCTALNLTVGIFYAKIFIRQKISRTDDDRLYKIRIFLIKKQYIQKNSY